METVSAFIPVDRRHALARRRLLADRTHGAVLFADISGFTPLTESLSRELGPQRGAEEISARLDRIYGVMIARVHNYAGSVISFSGDAITCWFDDHPLGATVAHNGAVRAAACALAIQAAVNDLGPIRTPQGSTIGVGMKVAVAAGSTRRFLLGHPGAQRFEVLAGSLVDRTVLAEQLLRPGEIAVGAEVVEQFGPAMRPVEWRTAPSGDTFAIIAAGSADAVHAHIPPSPWQPIPAIDPDLACSWMLRPVYERMQSIEGHFLAELRPVVSLFLSFTGINYERDDDAGQKLYDYISWIQATLNRYEGHLLQLTIGDKGSYCFIVFGAVNAHEDDPIRAIAAAGALNHPPPEVAFIKEIRTGISRGVLHVGAYGSPTRRTFGVTGNETNVAARLMSAAQPGQILVTSKVARTAAHVFQFQDLGGLALKGIAQPVPVLALSGSGPPAPASGARAALPSTVVGRDAELTYLRRRLQRLQNGQSSTVTIEGDAGIGKSRLLAALLDQAHQAAIPALVGAGDAIELATPYFAWRPIFRALFAVDEGDAPHAIRARIESRLPAGSDVRDLLPLLNTVLPTQWPDNELTSQLAGEARANSTRSLLLQLLSLLLLDRGPALLAFDDAHWLDSASAALLSQARRVLSPVLFVVVTRSGAQDGAARTEYEHLLQAPDVERLQLNTLGSDQVVQLVCQRLGVSELPVPVASFIVSHGEGHPFFSEEIAFALRDAGYLHIADGRCRLANGHSDLRSLDFPVTIQGVVTSRIDRLDSFQQLTLKVASVLGRVFLVRVLQNIYPSPAVLDQLPSQLSALERRDLILREAPLPDLSYIFKHHITQEVVYNLMTFSQRQQLHRSAARWYESRYGDDLAPYYPLLAHHWSRAEDHERAIFYLDKAGEQALRNFANEEAVDFFSQALESDAAAGFLSSSGQRALWELKIGEAYVHWTRYVEGREHLERGLALLNLLVPFTNSHLHNARHAISSILRQLLHRARPRRYLASRRGEEVALCAASRAYSRLVEVYYHSGDTLRSMHAAFHTLNLAELAGDSPELAEAYAPIGAFFSFLRIHPLANAYFQRALAVAAHVNSLSARSFVLLTKATYESGIGRWQDARHTIEELIAIGQRLGAQRRYNDGLQLQTILHYLLSEFESCRTVGAALLASARQLNDLRFQGYGLFACAFGNFHLGELETAHAQLQELQQLFELKNGVTDNQLALLNQGLWCLVHLAADNLPRALEAADLVARHAEGAFQVSYWTLPAYAGAAEALLTAWELAPQTPDIAQRAGRAVRALNRYARTFPIGRPAARLYQGWREHLRGNSRRAMRNWQKGLQSAHGLSLSYEAGRLSYEIARHRPASPPAHWAQAHDDFTRLGAVHGLSAVQTALAHDRPKPLPFFTSAARD